MAVKSSKAINAGNATVNSANFVDAIDPVILPKNN